MNELRPRNIDPTSLSVAIATGTPIGIFALRWL
jgi:hypothetical protein